MGGRLSPCFRLWHSSTSIRTATCSSSNKWMMTVFPCSNMLTRVGPSKWLSSGCAVRSVSEWSADYKWTEFTQILPMDCDDGSLLSTGARTAHSSKRDQKENSWYKHKWTKLTSARSPCRALQPTAMSSPTAGDPKKSSNHPMGPRAARQGPWLRGHHRGGSSHLASAGPCSRALVKKAPSDWSGHGENAIGCADPYVMYTINT